MLQVTVFVAGTAASVPVPMSSATSAIRAPSLCKLAVNNTVVAPRLRASSIPSSVSKVSPDWVTAMTSVSGVITSPESESSPA